MTPTEALHRDHPELSSIARTNELLTDIRRLLFIELDSTPNKWAHSNNNKIFMADVEARILREDAGTL